MTTRQNFTPLTRKNILTDLEGQPVKCVYPGCRCNAYHAHHDVYACDGGSNLASNGKPMCSKHHIQLHSVRGDFAKWGAKGGKKTAATGAWKKNLKQYQKAIRF